jgi:hypothetical protein
LKSDVALGFMLVEVLGSPIHIMSGRMTVLCLLDVEHVLRCRACFAMSSMFCDVEQ